jgi:hypothetical protein
VVGYQERCNVATGPEDDTEYWREYLLYHREAGFAFLVDSNAGWSWVRPITGAPTVGAGRATWQGVTYRAKEAYLAKVTWVQGEFYWRVQRDETARVSDYEGTGSAASSRLSREETAGEVVWSAGQTLPAATVADAFDIAPGARAALQRDALPVAFGSGGVRTFFIVVAVLILLLILLLTQCSSDRCDEVKSTFGAASTEYQQCSANTGGGSGGRVGGGSYGGWSSGGGGHK